MVDKNCQYVKHEFYDLTRVAEPGDYYCYAPSRGQEKDEYGGPAGHSKCTSENHKECFWHSPESRLKNLIKK